MVTWSKSPTLFLLVALPIAFGVGSVGSPVVAQSVLRWKIEATVVRVDDPDMIFSDVRLGDPVRGTMSYDLSIVPGFVDVGFDQYVHSSTFLSASMIIHNPRTDEDLEFVPAAGSGDDMALTFVANNYDAFGTGEVVDAVGVVKSVVTPAGFTGTSPAVIVELAAPTKTIADTRLPSALSLDVWTTASIQFKDAFDSSELVTSIYAEISSLTPVVAGDFDSDGDVDGADLANWQSGFGQASGAAHAQGDADGDSDVDGADFLVWQRQTGVGETSASVPEDSSLRMLLSSPLLLTVRRRFQ